MSGSETEQRLEASRRGAPAVVAEDELVEIDLQVLGRDAVVGALQPGLEVGERAVRAWQDELTVGEASSLFARLVVADGPCFLFTLFGGRIPSLEARLLQ